MTKATLLKIKFLTTWCGVAVTAVGVTMNIMVDGSIKGSVTAIVGICITALGHLVAHNIDKQTELERRRDAALIEELTDRVSTAEAFAEDPAIKEVMDNYAIEHQDDGR